MKHTNWRSNQHHPPPTPLKHEPEKSLAYFTEKFLKAFLWSHNHTSVRLYLPKDDLIWKTLKNAWGNKLHEEELVDGTEKLIS